MSPERPARRVTIADVAQLARVDPSVVSRVINADQRLVIKQETRERVHDAIRELRYHPNAAARSLRTSQAGTLGLLIPDFTNPIYAEIIAGAERAATAGGALLLVGSAVEQRPDRYVQMLASGRVDGLLLAVDSLPRATVDAMVATGRDIVSVNQRIPGVQRTILADDEGAARLATDYLLELGHRRIAHLRGPARSDTARRRQSGFRKALTAAGIRAAEAPVVPGGYSTQSGVEAVRDLLALPVRPTAVVVANIAAAIGAVSALHEAGVDVPAQMSVVAIHDHALAAHLSPPLTTVRMPLGQIGQTAVEVLGGAAVAAGPDGVTVVDRPTELIVRRSTAPPSRRR